MDFGDFPRDHNWTVAQLGTDVLQHLDHPVRGLIEDECLRGALDFFKGFAARGPLPRQETQEAEFVHGQSRCRQRRHES